MNKWKVIFAIFFFAVVVLVLTQIIIPQENGYELRTPSDWKEQNQNLLIKNQSLDLEIEDLEKQVDSLTALVSKNTVTIGHLKTSLNEKITTISGYSDAELLLYFSRFKTDSTAHKK